MRRTAVLARRLWSEGAADDDVVGNGLRAELDVGARQHARLHRDGGAGRNPRGRVLRRVREPTGGHVRRLQSGWHVRDQRCACQKNLFFETCEDSRAESWAASR